MALPMNQLTLLATGKCAPLRLAVYLPDNVFGLPSSSAFTRMTHDDSLIRLRQADPLTLAKVYDRFYPEVYRYVHFRLEDEQVCEDIASEVFLRLLKTLAKKRGSIRNVRGWLLGTAAHLVSDHLRAHYRARRLLEWVTPRDETITGQGDAPERLAELGWQVRQVRQALQHLTPDQQHVLALRFADERSIEEVAQLMRRSVGAVKVLQFRALAALRRCLAKQDL